VFLEIDRNHRACGGLSLRQPNNVFHKIMGFGRCFLHFTVLQQYDLMDQVSKKTIVSSMVNP